MEKQQSCNGASAMKNEGVASKLGVSFKNSIKKFANPKFSASYVAKIAILTAISFILYAFAKFSLPFMFPSFLICRFPSFPLCLQDFLWDLSAAAWS